MAVENLKSQEDIDQVDDELKKEEIEKDDKSEETQQTQLREVDLSNKNRDRLRNKQVSIPELEAEMKQDLAAAEAELEGLINNKSTSKIALEQKDLDYLRGKIKSAHNPDQAKKILEEIQDFPETKRRELENKKEREKREAEKIPYESIELQKHVKEIKKILSSPETKNYIGTNQEKPFVSWCELEIKKNPSIKTAKDILYKLQHGETGIKPRKEFYQQKLQPKLDKYGISLKNTPYFEKEGLSERTAALKKIEDVEKEIEGMRNLGLYSLKAQKKIIQKMFRSPNEQSIHDMHRGIKSVIDNESSQYTSLNSSSLTRKKVNVHGMSIRAMSNKSVEMFLADYKDYDLETRSSTILNWEKIAENEGKLIMKLGEIYKDDKEGFKTALKSFVLLSYMDKEKALISQKILVEKNSKEDLEKINDLQHKSLLETEKARKKKNLSNKTARRFREYILHSEKLKDSSGNVDLEKLDKFHKDLTSESPIFESSKRNIAAYAWAKENKFIPLLKKREKVDPSISKQVLKNWLDDYNEGTFSERRKTYMDLKDETKEAEEKIKKEKEEEKELNITNEDKQKARESSPERTALINTVNENIKERTPESIEKGLTAIHLYLAFTGFTKTESTEAQDEEIEGLREKLKELQKNLGKSKEIDQSVDAEFDSEVDKIIPQDDSLQDDLKVISYAETADELIDTSERQHGGTTDARKRAEEDAMSNATSKVQEDLTKSFHDQTEKDETIGDEGTGTKITHVNFSEKRRLSDQEIYNLGKITYQEQAKEQNNQGGTNEIQIDNESGQAQSGEMRDAQQEQRKEKAEEKIAEEVVKSRRKKESNNFSDMAESAAAARAAKRRTKKEAESEVKKNG